MIYGLLIANVCASLLGVLVSQHLVGPLAFNPLALSPAVFVQSPRLFVVGTGGGNLRRFRDPPLPTTAVRRDDTWGVLKLTLEPSGYDWEFVPVEGETFTDSGSATCH